MLQQSTIDILYSISMILFFVAVFVASTIMDAMEKKDVVQTYEAAPVATVWFIVLASVIAGTYIVATFGNDVLSLVIRGPLAYLVLMYLLISVSLLLAFLAQIALSIPQRLKRLF